MTRAPTTTNNKKCACFCVSPRFLALCFGRRKKEKMEKLTKTVIKDNHGEKKVHN